METLTLRGVLEGCVVEFAFRRFRAVDDAREIGIFFFFRFIIVVVALLLSTSSSSGVCLGPFLSFSPRGGGVFVVFFSI
jgi:hypothetical protein